MLDTYASNEINSYIMFAMQLRRQNHNLPFMFSNTERRNKGGSHWVSMMNICPKNVIILFDSFGEKTLANIITSKNIDLIEVFFQVNDKESSNIFNVFTFNADKFNEEVNVKTLIKYVSKYAYDIFTFLNEFASKNNISKVKLYTTKKQVQDFNNSFCWCLLFIFYL